MGSRYLAAAGVLGPLSDRAAHPRRAGSAAQRVTDDLCGRSRRGVIFGDSYPCPLCGQYAQSVTRGEPCGDCDGGRS